MARFRPRFTSKGWWLWKLRQPREWAVRAYTAVHANTTALFRRWFPKRLSDEEQWQQWKSDVVDIKNHIVSLHKYRQIFSETTKILADHPQLSTDPNAGYWYVWLRTMYAHYMAMSVRRELDRGATVANLYHLLHQIVKRPKVISRSRYNDHYASSSLPPEFGTELADKVFTEYGGSGDYIDRTIVNRDLKATEKRAREVLEYANRIVAHRTEAEVAASIQNLNESVDALGDMLEKYYNLLAGAALIVEPSIIVDWQKAFTVPWMPPLRS